MTPAKLIRKIIEDRMKLFKLFSIVYTIPIITYVILDIFHFEFVYKIIISTVMLLIIRYIFIKYLDRKDHKILTNLNDKILEESHELAMLLIQNGLYRDHHLKNIIIEMAKVIENENNE